MQLFLRHFISNLVLESSFQIFPNHFDEFEILFTELARLQVPHGNPLRMHIAFLFQIVELVSWDIDLTYDFRRLHTTPVMHKEQQQKGEIQI
jgi:hypothetical protein